MPTTVSQQDMTSAPAILSGVVVSIDPVAYKCVVSTTSSHLLHDVSWMSPYLGSDRGSGFNYMPEPGDRCIVCIPADGSTSFIMGFMPLPSTSNTTGEAETSFTGYRPTLNPGDIHLGTKDGNFMVLRRGGVVQVGAGHTAQTVYIPIEGLIRSYFVKYHGFSPLGDFVWDHAEIDQSTAITETSDIPVILKFNCRDAVQDVESSVEIRMGRLTEDVLDSAVDSNLLREGGETTVDFVGSSATVETVSLPAGKGDKDHLAGAAKTLPGVGYTSYSDGGPSGLLSLTIDPQGNGVKYTLQLTRNGDMFIRSEANIHIEAASSVYVHADEKITLETDPGTSVALSENLKLAVASYVMEILQSGVINIAALSVNLTSASGSIQLGGPDGVKITSKTKISLDAPVIAIGKNPVFDVLLNASAWKTALELHQHISNAPGNPTGPSGVVTPGAIASSDTVSKILMG